MPGSTRKKDFRKRFGERVRSVREQRKLTKTELADLIGIERQDIYKIEQGIRNATLETIIVLAEALQVSVMQLFDFEEQLGSVEQFNVPKAPAKKNSPKNPKQNK